jgi:hypothetical protein
MADHQLCWLFVFLGATSFFPGAKEGKINKSAITPSSGDWGPLVV